MMVLSLNFLSNGCFMKLPKRYAHKKTRFADMYKQMEQSRINNIVEKEEPKKLTISASKMPLSAFLRWIADRTEASIICDQNLDNTPVTIDVTETPLPDILAAVARRMNVDLTQQGNLYFIGTLMPEDRGVLVRKVRRLDADNLKQTVEVLLSDIGRSAAFQDGLLVVGDRVRVLQRIITMLNQIEAADSNTWILQLHLISTKDTFNKELGIDTETALDIAVNFGTVSPTTQATAMNGSLTALLKAAKTTGSASIIAQPLILLLDGSTSKFQDGDTIPIPKKTVSENGVVTTNGFEYVETGLILTASIREVSPTTAKCDIEIHLTNIIGYVQEAPITNGQQFQTSAVLESGGIYLLGSLTRKQHTKDKEGTLFNTLFKNSVNDGDIQVWLRCYRIQGPIKNIEKEEFHGPELN